MVRDTERFEFNSDHPDAAAIAERIRMQVDDNIKDGLYDDARISAVERSNLHLINEEDEYINFYLRCLQNNALVDINDFEIMHEGGGPKGKAMVGLKKVIWKMQKFLTFRMWSQQNLINSNHALAFQTLFSRYEYKIAEMERKIECLERGEVYDPVVAEAKRKAEKAERASKASSGSSSSSSSSSSS